MPNLKTLNFIYAYPLDIELRRSFIERDQIYPERSEIKEVMVRWRKIWQETVEQHDIHTVLENITKRVPTRNLECFIFGRGLTPKSTPFMIPVWNRNQEQWSDEKFVDLMIHELLHVYLVEDNEKYWNFVRDKYSNEEPTVQNHFLLYSMLQKIYQELWNKEPLDFGRDNMPPGYAKAIAMVKANGAVEYIEEYYKAHETLSN